MTLVLYSLLSCSVFISTVLSEQATRDPEEGGALLCALHPLQC